MPSKFEFSNKFFFCNFTFFCQQFCLENFNVCHQNLWNFLKKIPSRWNNAEDAPRAPLPSTTMDDMANNVGINQKAAREKQRIEIEKRRKKAQKKKERLAAMDAAGERQKKSWQNFSAKVTKKKKTGVVSEKYHFLIKNKN